jgi:hypothetical protein
MNVERLISEKSLGATHTVVESRMQSYVLRAQLRLRHDSSMIRENMIR